MTKFSFGLLAAAASLSASAAQVTVYNNDFSSGAGSAWSTNSTTTSASGETFLGEFSNDTATLSLSGLASHSAVTISFDLYILKSWDGNSFNSSVSPDLWGITVNGVGNLNGFVTTFSNGFGGTQSYPSAFFQGSVAPRSGASANDTLGYAAAHGGDSNWGDSIYHVSFTTPHNASTFVAQLQGGNLQGVGDESWGVDNVTVSIAAVPEPESYAMFLAGLGILGGIARRRTAGMR